MAFSPNAFASCYTNAYGRVECNNGEQAGGYNPNTGNAWHSQKGQYGVNTTHTSAGTYTVSATVSDGSLSNTKSFTWTVTNVNRAPVITAVADQTNLENAPISLAVTASDPDGDTLTYSATGLPPALTINTATGLITGTLSYASAGAHSVTVSVSDGTLSASTSFTWTVTNVNRAPVITAITDQAHAENAIVSLAVTASDPDGDTLLYTYSTTGGRITGEGANATWDLAGVQPGTYTSTVEVDDGCGCISFSTTSVTVAACADCRPPCPTITVDCPTSAVTPGTAATVTVNLSGGAAGVTPTYNWSVSDGTIASGQGTPSISIDTTGQDGKNITATVEIGGLPPECQRSASCSTRVCCVLYVATSCARCC